MAAPQVSGSNYIRNSAASASVDVSNVPIGGWMVISVMTGQSGTTVTEPVGWTRLRNGTTSGTRRNFIFGKIKQSGDGSLAVFTQTAGVDVVYGLVWGTGGADVFTWGVGTPWTRGSDSAQPSGARYETIAPSITTLHDESLVIAIANEATLAQVQSREVSAVSPSGWTESLWLPQVAPSDRIETVWMGAKEVPLSGASGNVTVTYTSPQDNNGFGIQIAIPPMADIPQAPYIAGSPETVVVGSAISSFSVPRPSGVVSGDYLVVVVRTQHSNMTAEPASPGFTRLGPAFIPSDSALRVNGMYGKPLTDIGAEPASYTFTMTTGGASRLIAAAFIIRGVDINNPVAGFTDSYGGSSVTGGKSVVGHNLTSVPALTLFYGGSEFASPNDHTPLTTPVGFTPIVSATSSTNIGVSRTYMWVGTKETSQFTTTTESITWGVPAGSAAESISFRGLLGDAPSEEGDGFEHYNGNGDPVKVYYTTATTVRTPSDMISIRRGFTNVAEMLATPGFTWAHRGGSASWPEMSLHAYTQAVVRGYGVLEVSLGRTSDGVWFGLHDQTTDRTSGGTFGNASSQTWAQIQAQQIIIGAAGAPQPYMRWEEIVDAYGGSHIIVADPKYALGGFREEFLDLVQNSIGTDRAIIKYSGSGSGAAFLSTQARARGFETWGFFYAADASVAQGGNGALQTWGPSWTLIGMEHGASQAIWDEAIALGKPVIGHIAATQAQYNTAIAKGASGVQVSGVGIVEPVSWWNVLPKRANLLAEYRFNEGSGVTSADMSGNRRTVTVDSSTTWTASGHTGAGISTTGSAGGGAYHLTFANPTAAVTIMGWAKPADVSGEVPLFGFWSEPDANPNGSSQFTVYASRTAFGPSGVLNMSLRVNGTLNAVTGNTMTLNTWQHVAATFDGTNATLYRNGVAVQSTPLSGTLGVGYFNAVGLSNAGVDDVRVFNAALTQSEIQAWMNRTV